MSLALWTFAFLIAGFVVFALAALGDCPSGADGTNCRTTQNVTVNYVLVGELVAYLSLTWFLFIRRWRKG